MDSRCFGITLVIVTSPNTVHFQWAKAALLANKHVVVEKPFTVTKEEDVWVLSGKQIEKVFEMTKFESDEDIYRFSNKLSKMGVDEKLKEMGAVPGDKVRIKDFYFDYTD